MSGIETKVAPTVAKAIAGGWQAITPTNGWASSTLPVTYLLDPTTGLVYLRGTFSTLGATGSSPFTLPAGCRPGQKIVNPLMGNTLALPGRITIPTTGIVIIDYTVLTASIPVDGSIWIAEG